MLICQNLSPSSVISNNNENKYIYLKNSNNRDFMYNILLKKEMSLKKKFLFIVNNFTSPAFHRRHFTVSEKKKYC